MIGKKLAAIICFCAFFITMEASSKRYGNDFVTYSIGDRYERGDFMIKNDTFESTYAFYNWPKPYRLFYKIMNHDDLLSFAQFDIVDTEDPHQVHIKTLPTCYEVIVESAKQFRGFVKIYHKAPENFVHFSQIFPGYQPSSYPFLVNQGNQNQLSNQIPQIPQIPQMQNQLNTQFSQQQIPNQN